VVDPNILSLNQLSETLNKAEVLAAEIALIINSIAEIPSTLGACH
jgi:hypothetical protein